MNRFRTLFLDAAGTIIRPAEPPGEAYARIGREHGLQVTAAAMKQAFVQAWKGTAHPLHPEGMVWYGMVWYGMVWYGMVWYGMSKVMIMYGMV